MGNNFLVLQNEILMAIIHQFKVRSSQVSLSGRNNGISRGLPTMMVKNTVKKGGVNICLLKIVIITFHQLCSDCVCYRLIILHSPPGRRGHDQMVVGFTTPFMAQRT